MTRLDSAPNLKLYYLVLVNEPMDEMKLQVLWVDDQPKDEFLNEAFEYGLDITVTTCVNDGITALKDTSKSWDAIILDANCKITGDEQEQPTLKALQNAIKELLRQRTSLPWFVYTGGDYEGVEHLEFMIHKRDYDDRLYYEKPKHRYELYDNIKKAVSKSEVYAVKQKYSSVCSFYKDSDLVELLLEYENNKETFRTDTSVPNRVRKIIEWIMRYFESVGLLTFSFTGTNISTCSRFVCELRQLVPVHVIRSLHFCVDVCNNGSHDLEVASLISGDEAPFLNNSILMNLLNILHWCPNLMKYEKDELKKKVENCLEINRIEKESRKKSK